MRNAGVRRCLAGRRKGRAYRISSALLAGRWRVGVMLRMTPSARPVIGQQDLEEPFGPDRLPGSGAIVESRDRIE